MVSWSKRIRGANSQLVLASAMVRRRVKLSAADSHSGMSASCTEALSVSAMERPHKCAQLLSAYVNQLSRVYHCWS